MLISIFLLRLQHEEPVLNKRKRQKSTDALKKTTLNNNFLIWATESNTLDLQQYLQAGINGDDLNKIREPNPPLINQQCDVCS